MKGITAKDVPWPKRLVAGFSPWSPWFNQRPIQARLAVEELILAGVYLSTMVLTSLHFTNTSYPFVKPQPSLHYINNIAQGFAEFV
jgi:hypothetical protein